MDYFLKTLRVSSLCSYSFLLLSPLPVWYCIIPLRQERILTRSSGIQNISTHSLFFNSLMNRWRCPAVFVYSGSRLILPQIKLHGKQSQTSQSHLRTHFWYRLRRIWFLQIVQSLYRRRGDAYLALDPILCVFGLWSFCSGVFSDESRWQIIKPKQITPYSFPSYL